MLDPSFWISGVLNDVFVSGLSAFVSCSLCSKIPPVSSKSCIFQAGTVVHARNQSLVSIAKWHVTIPAYRDCIKNDYLQ